MLELQLHICDDHSIRVNAISNCFIDLQLKYNNYFSKIDTSLAYRTSFPLLSKDTYNLIQNSQALKKDAALQK